MIRQALTAVCQKRNHDALTVARFTQTYVNAHLKENTPAYEDESIFLPHPMVWRKYQHQRKISVSREVAIEFLSSYKKFGMEVAVVFNEWLTDLEDIAVC